MSQSPRFSMRPFITRSVPLLVILPLLFASACFRGFAADACAAVECSGHGMCSVGSDGEPSCLCDPGFRAVDLECVPIESGDVCLEVTCSGHGQCATTTDGTPLCLCDEGYVVDDDPTKCEPELHPCQDISCIGPGTCVWIVAQGPYCSCDEGFHNAAPLECVADET